MNKSEKEKLLKNITQYGIPIITVLSTFITSLMTASKFIERSNILHRNSIYNTSLIDISSNEIVANIFISIISSILFIIALFNIKNINKCGKFKISISAIIVLLVGTFILNYDIFFKYNYQLVFIVMLMSTGISYFTLYKIKIENLVMDSILLGISIILTIAITPIFSTYFLPNNNITLTKYKNEITNDNFEKFVIYQTNEYSVLCNYDLNEDNKIKKDCTTYEMVNNTDLIFKTYSK